MTPYASPTLDAVRALAPEVAAAVQEAEKARALAPEIVDKLSEAGIFRMLVPKAYGGDELSQAQVGSIIETLAAADAAAAWTAMVAVGFNIVLARFPRATADAVYAHGPNVRLRGGLAPIGAAGAVDGGYVINGRWPFASGPYEANYVAAGCVVMEDGRPRMGPMGPDVRVALVPAEQATFLDTWDSVGLRGTDSTDYELRDVFVPEDYAANIFDLSKPPVYGPNLPFPMMTGPNHSAVCLGVVSAALEELGTLARTKRSAFNPTQTLGEGPIFRHRLGELAVRHAALEALTESQLREVAQLVEAGGPPDPVVAAKHASYVGYVHQQAVDIVNEIFSLAGSAPVYSRSPLQRHWRDVRVAAQHFGGSTAQYPVYGGFLAGETVAAIRH